MHCVNFFFKINKVKVVEINAELGDVKLCGDVESLVFTCFVLNSAANVVEVVVGVEFLSIVKRFQCKMVKRSCLRVV